MYNSIDPIQPIYSHKAATAVRLSNDHLWRLDLAASRRRQKTGNNVTRADLIREAVHVFLENEGVTNDALSP